VRGERLMRQAVGWSGRRLGGVMHRIGEFASLTGLSVKTLRFYDEIGLLMPASVGSHTGYRLYSADQVERARYILSLRQFGLTLAEIKAILATGASERDALE